MHGADSVASDSRVLKEGKDHIRNALRINGYLEWILGSVDPPKPLDEAAEGVEKRS